MVDYDCEQLDFDTGRAGEYLDSGTIAAVAAVVGGGVESSIEMMMMMSDRAEAPKRSRRVQTRWPCC